MKKEKANGSAQKQSINDFAHRLTIQLTEQHYVDYAMTHSQDQIQKGRQTCHFVGGAVHNTGIGCHL